VHADTGEEPRAMRIMLGVLNDWFDRVSERDQNGQVGVVV